MRVCARCQTWWIALLLRATALSEYLFCPASSAVVAHKAGAKWCCAFDILLPFLRGSNFHRRRERHDRAGSETQKHTPSSVVSIIMCLCNSLGGCNSIGTQTNRADIRRRQAQGEEYKTKLISWVEINYHTPLVWNWSSCVVLCESLGLLIHHLWPIYQLPWIRFIPNQSQSRYQLTIYLIIIMLPKANQSF
jgi:hypothetical protein